MNVLENNVAYEIQLQADYGVQGSNIMRNHDKFLQNYFEERRLANISRQVRLVLTRVSAAPPAAGPGPGHACQLWIHSHGEGHV